MSALWVLGAILLGAVLLAALGLRHGAHPARGHCGPMCQLGQVPAAPADPQADPSSTAPPAAEARTRPG